MCILLLTTAHPDYALLLLSNRDEYLARPTAPAHQWPETEIIAGRDLLRVPGGTWLGVSRGGRIAALTNFREPGDGIGVKSRGLLVSEFLEAVDEDASLETAEDGGAWCRRMIGMGETWLSQYGGFSLICGVLNQYAPLSSHQVDHKVDHQGDHQVDHKVDGQINRHNRDSNGKQTRDTNDKQNRDTNGNQTRDTNENKCKIKIKINRLNLLTNRARGVRHVLQDADTLVLSNSDIDAPWPKVALGRSALSQTIQESVSMHPGDEGWLIEALFGVLCRDSMVERTVDGIQHSVFIPAFETERGWYGTRQQTVLLVDREGRCRYVERTLYDALGQRMDSVVTHEFQLRD